MKARLGSYSEPKKTWCWSWAEGSFHAHEYAQVLKFREHAYESDGVGAFWRPGFFCDGRFSARMAHFITEEMGGTAIFQDNDGEGLTTFYALMG